MFHMKFSLIPRGFPLLCILIGCDGTPPPLAVTEAPFAPDSGSIAIRCGNLIDGLSDEVRAMQLVIIRNGRFERIGDGDASAAGDISYLDLSKHTCLPGLLNTHVHLAELPEDANDLTVYYRRTTDD
ncbi:MAG: hypothetical protein OEM60_12950, partial [Gammaproteobacteria bacterium]|nr:hypothetical protein [Gammaproteobacteria bacterium]